MAGFQVTTSGRIQGDHRGLPVDVPGSGASAGSNHFRHFPAQRAGRFAFVLFLAVAVALNSLADNPRSQHHIVSKCSNGDLLLIEMTSIQFAHLTVVAG